MDKPRPKPPGFRPPPAGGTGRKLPPPPRGSSLPAAGMSIGTRIGLGVAIGLFSSIAIVIVGAVAVKVMSRGGRDVAEVDSTATPRAVLAEPVPINNRPPIPHAPQPQPEPVATDSPPVRETQPDDSTDSLPKENENPLRSELAPAPEPAPEPPQQDMPKEEAPVPTPEEARPPAAPASEAPVLLGELQGLTLALPKPATFGAAGRVHKLVELSDALKSVVRGESEISPAPEVSLKLLGVDVVFDEDDAVTLESLEVEKTPREGAGWDEHLVERAWAIRSNAAAIGGRTPELGRFTIRDGWLAFEWDRIGSKAKMAALLQYCLLEISVGGRADQRERAVCKLGEPAVVMPAAVNLLQPNEKIELSLDKDKLPPAHQLRMDLVFEKFPRHEREAEGDIEVDEVLTTSFFIEPQADEDQPALEIEARFEFEDHPLASFEVFVHPDRLVAGIDKSDRTLFLTRDTATLNREHKNRLRFLEQQKRALEPEEPQAKAALRAVENELRATPLQNRAPLEQQQQFLQARIAAIGNSLAEIASESKQIKLEEEWRTQVTKLLSSLKTAGRIGLHLSIEIDGQRVVIAAPKSE
jgi:hypothetical protein